MSDHLTARVFPKLYRDSVTLMALAASAQRADGVHQVGAVMATAANLSILAESGMLPAGVACAADDLIVVVRATDEATAAAALETVEAGLLAEATQSRGQLEFRPATVREGLQADEALTVAAVSTPGTYAPIVVEQALRRGLHVFCFSDNVDIADELRLKRIAASSGLLLMGPDCGTAVLDGVPLGFANAVRPGPVAIVAASGTGAQEVSCLLDAAGIGVSQIVGVGGRDLSAEIGGIMTDVALDLVCSDPGVELVILVSKPPAPQVAGRLLDRLARLDRPAIACLLGQEDSDGAVPVRGTLEGGAVVAASLLGRDLAGAALGSTVTESDGSAEGRASSGVVGLYTGGTLAGEAKHILSQYGVAATIVDLGADEYTAGRPHPMIDPAARVDRVRAVGTDPRVGTLLVDLVLGFGAAADPATPLATAVAEAIAAARADGRRLVVAGSVCGTEADPQGLPGQRKILADAGVRIFPSNAAAVRFAAAMSLEAALAKEIA